MFGYLCVGAFDVGFAQNKIVILDFNVCSQFPSAVAEPPSAMAGMNNGLKIYKMDYGTFVFGEDAMKPGMIQIPLLNEELLIKHMPGLICASADAAGVDLCYVDVLSTGLTLNAWLNHRGALQQSLKTIHCNEITYKFERVDIRPQCLGALGGHSKITSWKYPCGLILDIGAFSTQMVRYNHCIPTAKDSRQYNELGLLSASRCIVPLLAQIAGGRIITDSMALKALREKKYCGQEIVDQVDAVVFSYTELLLSVLGSDYKYIMLDLDEIIITGGGAHLVAQVLKNKLPNVKVLDDPEFANVRGYAYLSELQE